MARCISFTSSEEYLCGVFYDACCQPDYAIYRWKLTGLHGEAEPETTYFRLPAVADRLAVGALASIGSKIYMIGGDYRGVRCLSTDIFVVDTDKLHTQDTDQIVKKIPSVLRSYVRDRNAVAIGRKIYLFPVDFRCEDPPPPSRFEVFDPETETTQLLPEPRFRDYRPQEYLVTKRHILICSGERFLYAFDTIHPTSGWRDISADFYKKSIGIHVNPMPFLQTLLKEGCATVLGGRDDDGSRFFSTVTPEGDGPYHGIFKVGEDPLRIEKWYPIYGIPEKMIGEACFAHEGSVFFTYLEDDRPKSGIRVWIFKKYSLFHHSVEKEYYSAQEDFCFQIEHPCSYEYDCLASFVIPGSI